MKYKLTIEKKGFKIVRPLDVDSIGINGVAEVVFEQEKKQAATDMKALVSSYGYLADIRKSDYIELTSHFPIDFYYNRLDLKALETKEKHGKRSSYGLKAKDIMRESMTHRETVFTSLVRSTARKAKRNNAIKDKDVCLFFGTTDCWKLLVLNADCSIFLLVLHLESDKHST